VNHNDDMQQEPWVLPHMLPVGCDSQGRHTTRPMPAEACTEIGFEEEPDFTAAARFWTLYLSLAIVAIVAAVASLV
jgi:hypothetical protein